MSLGCQVGILERGHHLVGHRQQAETWLSDMAFEDTNASPAAGPGRPILGRVGAQAGLLQDRTALTLPCPQASLSNRSKRDSASRRAFHDCINRPRDPLLSAAQMLQARRPKDAVEPKRTPYDRHHHE